jgi:hypothetical protein
MNREAVLQSAFDRVHWQEDDVDILGSAGLYRLSNTIAFSVETIAVHSLHRLHLWLWPMVSTTPVGDTFQIGDVRFSVVERLPAIDREDSKTGLVIEADDRSWKLVWIDIDGHEPLVAVGVRNDEHYSGYEPAANCELKDGTRYKGALNATGDDVGSMFDLFAVLGPLMPEALLKVKDGSHNDWNLDGAEDILELDGGLGGEAAAELYRMAEQYACARVFDWAGQCVTLVSNFLHEQEAFIDGSYFRHSDGNRLISAVETGREGRFAFVDSQLPHRNLFDRYLTWVDVGMNGAAEAISIFAIPEFSSVMEIAELLQAGELDGHASVSYDYASGRTSFAPGRLGFNHIAEFATALNADVLLAVHFNPEDEGVAFERRKDCELFVEVGAPAPAR